MRGLGLGLESGSVQDLSMSDAEARAAVEAFYDCVNSDEEVRSYLLSQWWKMMVFWTRNSIPRFCPWTGTFS